MRKLVIGLMFCAIIAIGGMEFDGVDDFVNVGDNLDMGLDDFTVSYWLKTTETGVASPISKAKQVGEDRWFAAINNVAGKARFALDDRTSGSSFVSVDSSITVNDDKLHHIVGVYDRDGDLTLYIDGIADGNASIAASVAQGINNSVRMKIGAFGDATDSGEALHLNGLVYRPQIWRHALTATEVKALYDSYGNGWPNDGTNTIPPAADWIGARGYSDGATITNGNARIYDISGNGLHGTATNGVKQATVSVPTNAAGYTTPIPIDKPRTRR